MEGDVVALERRLRELKRRGASVLLLGSSSVAVCERLLGDDRERRRRLFVVTDGCRTGSHGQQDRDPDWFGLVEVPGDDTRSTYAAAHCLDDAHHSTPTGPIEPAGPGTSADRDHAVWFSRVAPDAGLATLAWHIQVHISRFEAAGSNPNEIRVCFDSLDSFADRVEHARLVRFLHAVIGRVKAAHGLVHFHLSSTTEPSLREALVPLFDIVIETRRSSSGPQQRWTLRDDDIRTGWLPVGPDSS